MHLVSYFKIKFHKSSKKIYYQFFNNDLVYILTDIIKVDIVFLVK